MGFEELIYDTKLTLSLGPDDAHEYDHHHHQQQQQQNKRSKLSPKSDNYLPSLSLGLPWELLKFEVNNNNNSSNGSSESMVRKSNASPSGPSSLLDSSLKREVTEVRGGREVEEAAEEGGSGSYELSYEVCTRKKLRLSKEQSIVLEDSFKEHTTLYSKQKQDLARRLNLRPRQVEVWFQNRRARTKLKKTEVDYELLRNCYETLTDENRRLQKELQDQKAANQTTPFHVAAATLTMCPSCESTHPHGGSGDNSNKFSLSTAGQKSCFYRSFLNPSAAC